VKVGLWPRDHHHPFLEKVENSGIQKKKKKKKKFCKKYDLENIGTRNN
jgi:hypothetical protein